jgi:metallo-beta-lactamase family protein
MKTTIQFCGAAGTVTGSCYWIRHYGRNFLIDCGIFQGSKTLKALNYDKFPFNPESIDFVLLTHAHMDHSGLIPKLIKNGFMGKVHATEGTRDLLSFMLPDSGYIHETEVAFLNRRNRQRGMDDVAPIYTQADAEKSISRFVDVDYEEWRDLGEGIRARFWNAGHILGAASIELELSQKNTSDKPIRLLFSGDIGPEHKLFHPDPIGPRNLDYLICEATYGDRLRENLKPAERRHRLGQVISQALAGEGVLVIPAFSVERTQELLADISLLMRQKSIKESMVFLDSPMAIRATRTFARHADSLEDIGKNGDLFENENFVFTKTVEESKNINMYKSGVIIIAASGMCDAGRIRHHLKRRLWDRNTTVLMVGYQAPGTLGSILLSGKKAVRIQGEDIKVRAHIKTLDIYSGHADANGLQEWVLNRLPIHRAVFLTHGEPGALEVLQKRLIDAGLSPDHVLIPNLDDEYELTATTALKQRPDHKPRLAVVAAAKLDWHNDLAQLSLDIREELENAADEKSKQKILRRLRRALDNESA